MPGSLLFAQDMSFFRQFRRRINALRASIDAGMSTAEYAVGTIAAVAFAALHDSVCLVRSHLALRVSGVGGNQRA